MDPVLGIIGNNGLAERWGGREKTDRSKEEGNS
jgi:hypothetical protein